MIVEAIAALEAQDFHDWELLIVDGGIPVHALIPRDSRIGYYWRPDLQPIERTNLGIQQSSGEILNLCADDDLMRPSALSHVSAIIGSAQWLYGRINYGDSGMTMGHTWNYAWLKRENYIPAPATFWTREAGEKIGPFDTGNRFPDWDFWLRLGAVWPPVFTDQVLVDYRLHDGQDTNTMGSVEAAMARAEILRRVSTGYYECRT
jgi:glycosyltransferase involved in cell wall biosynthesis